MAERDIVQNLISQLGQSQDDRLTPELDVHFADVDERGPEELLRFWKRLAPLVRHYGPDGAEDGDWTPFFAGGGEEGNLPPHLALLRAFAELNEIPREAVNRLTGRHLDFFYRRVLRFEPRPPLPDRAHLLVELKKGSAPIAIGPQHAFSAGKDAAGAELLYVPTAETVIHSARVESLRSIYKDPDGRTVRFAPIANSVDGLGAPLPDAEPKWRAFGFPELPAAEVGFAAAAPVLRMKEGSRTVTLTLGLGGLNPRLTAAFTSSFAAYLTGEKGWLGPYGLTGSLSGGLLGLTLVVPESAGGVVDYDPALHGYAYAAEAPVLQLLLQPGAPLGYEDLAGLAVSSARIDVEVAGVTSLALESDAGTLDPKKTFLPFGPQPTVGSRFLVGSPEVFSKRLTRIDLHLQWQGTPGSFRVWYTGYTNAPSTDDGGFTARIDFQDGAGWQADEVRRLFDSPGLGETTLTFTQGGAPVKETGGHAVWSLHTSGSARARSEARRKAMAHPVLAASSSAPPAVKPGFLTLSLLTSFLHADYRKESVANLVAFSRSGRGDGTDTPVVLNEPYTPALRAVSLSYHAQSGEADLIDVAETAFASADLRFFHVGPFGQRREHAYLRQSRHLPLLPEFENEGELLLGLSGLAAGDGVSLLFQVAEGSADPDLPRQDVQWSALCDNHWQAIAGTGIARDTTRGLLTSGVVGLVIPREATLENTFLPAGRIWLRAAVRRDVDAVSRLIAVAANAVEVRFADQGNDPGHLRAPLPAGKIFKLKTPVAAVKTVKQPYASFGGSPAEPDAALRARAAERLRHRDRCITPWDYERIVLAAFPGVHKVKCIPHAKDGSWLAPGNVMLVVVPDLRNRNAVDPLRPRVDADTLSRIADHVQRRAGMQVRFQVRNPRYQSIRLDFKVRFLPGYEFNFYRDQVNQELVRFLSPWAFDATRPISFGGKVYKSVLLDFVEKLAPVDFVTDFRMFSGVDAESRPRDVEEIQAETPDAILVSAAVHGIAEVA
jgi:hypothetical protein